MRKIVTLVNIYSYICNSSGTNDGIVLYVGALDSPQLELESALFRDNFEPLKRILELCKKILSQIPRIRQNSNFCPTTPKNVFFGRFLKLIKMGPKSLLEHF